METDTPLIYNLFPRLAGPMPEWERHARRAASMRFNWIYLNPLHYPGFSGSLYAVKDYYRINPSFLPPDVEGDGLPELRRTLCSLCEIGLRPIMDLVVNHTAKDSPLVREHPTWYRWENGEVASPYAVDPDDPTKRTVWGDLAEIDNEDSPDRAALWKYWADLVRHSVDLGFAGFRCDAAYKLPAELWRYLIAAATEEDPKVMFFAETLGCTIEQVLALRDAGFHFILNSSKWWDFKAPWALEQHEKFRRIAPSISFPETHDTARLAAETDGNEGIQRQRYAFAAAFSAGIMMPVGFEFGFRKRLNVVRTRPEDWEAPTFDLTAFIRRVNELKLTQPILQGEGELRALLRPEETLLVLERQSDRARGAVAWIVLNKDRGRWQRFRRAETFSATPRHRLYRACRDNAPTAGEPLAASIELQPSEVIFLLENDNSSRL